MKKIILFLLVICFSLSSQAQLVKKMFKKPEVYDNLFIYFYLKPVNLDTAMIDKEKTYEIEGYLQDGKPALAFVKGDILKQIMALKWPTEINQLSGFPGKAFTANYLGKESFIKENDIPGTKFDESQKDILLRDMDKQKFEIRSALPINIKGQIDVKSETIKLCTTCQ
jgi:hypothetical protein